MSRALALSCSLQLAPHVLALYVRAKAVESPALLQVDEAACTGALAPLVDGGECFFTYRVGNDTTEASVVDDIAGYCATCSADDLGDAVSRARSECGEDRFESEVGPILNLRSNLCGEPDCIGGMVWRSLVPDMDGDLLYPLDASLICSASTCYDQFLSTYAELYLVDHEERSENADDPTQGRTLSPFDEIFFDNSTCLNAFTDLNCIIDDDTGSPCVEYLQDGNYSSLCQSSNCIRDYEPARAVVAECIFPLVNPSESGYEEEDDASSALLLQEDDSDGSGDTDAEGASLTRVSTTGIIFGFGPDWRIDDLCTQNENDDYCTLLVFNSDELDEACTLFLDINAHIDDLLSVPCSEQCAAATQTQIDSLGCCFTFWLSFYEDAHEQFVTEQCGLSLPAPCERPSISPSSDNSSGNGDGDGNDENSGLDLNAHFGSSLVGHAVVALWYAWTSLA